MVRALRTEKAESLGRAIDMEKGQLDQPTNTNSFPGQFHRAC